MAKTIFRETAQQRARKNLNVIREQLNDVANLIGDIAQQLDEAPNTIDWGHVGSLAHFRGCLNEILGRDDKDPE